MNTPLQIWSACHRGVCSITHLVNGERLGQGTGFLVGTWLVTNNHVIRGRGASHVRVQFVAEDGHTITAAKQFTSAAFAALLVDGEPEASWDFAILRADFPEFAQQTGIELSSDPPPPIGAPISFLGFQFEDQNLSIGSGFLASRYSRSKVDYLQLDASVNHGNSGGPLIEAGTGRAIGLVTRKATGLTRQFDELLASFDANIVALQQAQAIMHIGGVDPIEGFRISQQQLKGIGFEMRRSANVGIGYAYDISRVRNALIKLGYNAP